MTYRVYFSTNESIVITEKAFEAIVNGVATTSEIIATEENQVINFRHVTHIVADALDSRSFVVTPPTPQQLKAEREIEQANADVSLDAQLENPEVGA